MRERDDQRICYKVTRLLGLLPQVNIRDARVTVSRGVVRLHGIARRAEEKEAPLTAVREIAGVLGVDDAVLVDDRRPD